MLEFPQWSYDLSFGPRNLLLSRFSLVITNGGAALQSVVPVGWPREGPSVCSEELCVELLGVQALH